MRVLITGIGGFLGKNLAVRLSERDDVEVLPFRRGDGLPRLNELLTQADIVFHLAGVNRPQNADEFRLGNERLSKDLCLAIVATGRPVPVVYASSTQAELSNPYGESKLAAEEALIELSRRTGSPIHIFRLPNVFGKWARPDYNSVVATFCYRIARELPIQINDPAAIITLTYVDDVIERFLAVADGEEASTPYCKVDIQYTASVGELAAMIRAFHSGRDRLLTERVGLGFEHALYATFVSYLPLERIAYTVSKYVDSRGTFVEMLKTRDSGQFSVFTANPGVTRGGHYHHSKTEKFLVVRGSARFRFRHILTGDEKEFNTCAEQPMIVETVPGWNHDITNVGDQEMIVMLWANEVFDRAHPDTISRPM